MDTWILRLFLGSFCGGYSVNLFDVRHFQNHTRVQGNTVILNCAMNESELWYRENLDGTHGETLFEGKQSNPRSKQVKRLSVVGRYDLQIVNLTKKDEGKYCCDVVNGHRSHGSLLKKICHEIFVLDPRLSITQLQNDSLLCNGTDIPKHQVAFKWEHYSMHNQVLGIKETGVSALLDISRKKGQPLYNVNGKYICSIRYKRKDENNSGIITSSKSKEVMLTGKPFCISQHNKSFGYVHEHACLVIHVYSSEIYLSLWHKEKELIQNSSRCQMSYTRSTTKVNIYGNVATVDSYHLQLQIQNLTKDDLNKTYSVTVSNKYGNSLCATRLIEAKVPVLFNISLQNSETWFLSNKWLLLYITFTLLATLGLLIGQHLHGNNKSWKKKETQQYN